MPVLKVRDPINGADFAINPNAISYASTFISDQRSQETDRTAVFVNDGSNEPVRIIADMPLVDFTMLWNDALDEVAEQVKRVADYLLGVTIGQWCDGWWEVPGLKDDCSISHWQPMVKPAKPMS